MNDESIKKNIARRRNDSGLSQTDMAEKVGMSRNAYRNLEQGDTRIINENVGKIAESLGISTEGLILGYEPVEADFKRLTDIRQEYAGKQKQLIADYESRLEVQRDKISLLEGYVEAQKEALKSKDEIISMLKRQLQSLRPEEPDQQE